MNRTQLTSIAVAVAALVSCKTPEAAQPTPAPSTASTEKAPAPTPAPEASSKPSKPKTFDPSAPMPPGLDEAAIDPSVDPCQDFYQYACGNWLAHTEIPADRGRWSRGFMEVDERNQQVLKEIADGLASGKPMEGVAGFDQSLSKKVGDYYGACMDEPKLENGLPALKAQLKQFDAIKDPASLATAIANLHRSYVQPVFTYSSTQDFKNATQVIGEVDQGGLGLPDRDYYLTDEGKNPEIRKLYTDWAATVFKLLGQDEKAAAANAEKVLSLEKSLAEASLSRVDRRDPEKLYHRIERAGLQKAAPKFRWDLYFTRLGTPKVDALNVTHPPYFEAVDKLATTVKPDVWKAYLTFTLVRSVNDALPKAFRDAFFNFESKALTGAPQDLPRYKKCVAATDEALGEALAQPFIAKTFGADGKQITSEMVQEVEASMERDIASLAWMDQETKTRAVEKLHKIVNKIGYPDKWRDYAALKVSRDSFLTNVLNAGAFEKARQLAKIGKPLDRGEWLMSPPTVNAYYNPPMNEIVFPAGILQPPFFNRQATYAVNFGAMGMVVGHEITHGFDDEGRQFDPEGNLHQWWTEASDKAFSERAQCVVDQYANEIAIDDIHLNGKLTLGENTADLGGVKLAYAAMKSYAEKKGALERTRYTPEQQFFLGFAQSWCTKTRPEFTRVRAKTDPHSPPLQRVNVPLRNFKGFREAFQCAEGSPMAPPEQHRCEVW